MQLYRLAARREEAEEKVVEKAVVLPAVLAEALVEAPMAVRVAVDLLAAAGVQAVLVRDVVVLLAVAVVVA